MQLIPFFYSLSATLFVFSPSLCTNNNYQSIRATTHAKQIITQFFKKASDQDKQLFTDYLAYYRSEGGYQAVTPAPGKLRESLSPDARNLWKKLTQLAQKFVQKPLGIPGSSKLTKAGEKYYQDLLAYTKELLQSGSNN